MERVKTIIRRFYAAEHLIKKAEKHGEIPSTKETYKHFFRVAWPATIESVLIGLVSFIDAMMVSVLGSAAIAAVGVTNQPRMLFFAVFFALNVGVTAIVSRRRGQGDRDGANECLSQAFPLAFVLGIILCATAIIVAKPLISFAGADVDIIDDSVRYFRIIMVGMLFTSMGLIINAAHRGTGNTKIAMITNITANIVNCIFNFLLISGNLGFPALGINGAAIATLIGNIVSFSISFYTVTKGNKYLHIRFRECLRINISILKLIAKIGGSAGVEQIFMRVGFFTYSMLVNNLGTVATSTHTICMNIISLSFTVGDGLGIASSALVGQNLGKKRPDLSLLYGKAGQRIGFLISAFLVLLFTFGSKMLVSLFLTDGDINAPGILEVGSQIMLLIAITSPAQISQVIFNGCLRGAGDTLFVAASSLLSIALIRPLVTYVLCYPLGLGLIGAWISLVVDQYLRLLLSAFRFAGGRWSKIVI